MRGKVLELVITVRNETYNDTPAYEYLHLALPRQPEKLKDPDIVEGA